ncbi:MAG: DUF349 domain-containing protein [Bacteroidetes bacterium]|nr:DUF349 domain-containing protein [Bacteroidota bacterium]
MKEDIIKRLEELVKEEMTEETFAKADEIKNEYLRACETITHDQLEKFLAEGGNADDFQPPKEEADSRFNELILILSDRESKYKRVKKAEIHSKMKAKEEIIAELQKLIAEETNIGKAFNAFKEIQSRWNEVGNIPNREYKEVQSAYHRHTHNFYYNMKLSKDLKELDFKRNLEFRTQLLSKIESLLQIESIRGMERMIKLYRMEWSEMGPTAPEKTEELRTRYRELIGEVYQKIRDYYKERQKEEQANLTEKKVLLERAVKISEEKFDTPKQWQTMTETLQKILESWKQIGFAPKAENEKLWEGFRNALKLFYANKKVFFTEIKKLHKGNKEKKAAIIAKAEEIAAARHDDWDTPTKQILQLQKGWKEAGHIDSWEENKMWKKFREACDKFFEAKRGFYNEKDADLVKNLEKKEELIKRLEAFQPAGKAEDDLKSLKDFSAEWKTIDHVPYKDKQRIYEKYKKVLDGKYDALKLEASQMHLIKFRNNVELLAQSEDSGNLMRKERSTIQDKIKRLQATINQYENNLGFFSNSKNMGGLLKEVEENLSKAKEELQMLQKKLKMFSEVAK